MWQYGGQDGRATDRRWAARPPDVQAVLWWAAAGHYYLASTRPRATHMADRPQEMMLWSSRRSGSRDLLLFIFPAARVIPFQRPAADSLTALLHPRGITGCEGFHVDA